MVASVGGYVYAVMSECIFVMVPELRVNTTNSPSSCLHDHRI
jgi:hypothetical protein